VNAIAGAFIVAFAAALSVYLMTRMRFPVSSSQAIVGAVIGIGLLKGGRGIRWRTLGGITSGWVITPIIAGVFCLVSLFFLQNVFHQ
jgi:PiT family inorganic phosphate transporter